MDIRELIQAGRLEEAVDLYESVPSDAGAAP